MQTLIVVIVLGLAVYAIVAIMDVLSADNFDDRER